MWSQGPGGDDGPVPMESEQRGEQAGPLALYTPGRVGREGRGVQWRGIKIDGEEKGNRWSWK